MKKFSSLLLVACIMCLCVALPAWSDSYADRLNDGNWQHLVGELGGNCKLFAKRVMNDVFGVNLPGTANDNRFLVSGRVVGSLYSGFSAEAVKAAFSNSQVGDVVQMEWKWGSVISPHTFIVISHNDSGVYTLEANYNSANEGANIKNRTHSWKELSEAYFRDGSRGGFTIYRYIGDISDGGSSGGSGNDDTQQKYITITTDSNLLSTTLGTYFNKQLECTGSGSTYWEIISGNRPDGIDIDHMSGLLRGNSERAGTFTFTVQARNDSGTGTKEFTLTVNAPNSSPTPSTPTPTITIKTDSNLPSTTKGTYFNVQLECTGSGSTYWEIIGGNRPDGIDIDHNSGLLSGKSERTGTFTFTVQARKDSGTGSKQFTLTVKEPNSSPTPSTPTPTITITTDSNLPGTTKGTYFNKQLECSGSGQTHWEKTSGTYPDGIEIDQFSGLLHGTSKRAGTFAFTIQARNDSGTGSKTFTLTVNNPDKLTITTDRVLPSDNKGSGYDFHFSTNKGSARWELIGGSLPPGIKLDEGSGRLYSTFEQAGIFTFRLRAANDYGTDEKEFTITVRDPNKLTITTDSVLPSDTKGSGYDFTFSTNKGSARWELIGGSLPPGIKLDEGSGRLYSTFEQAGTFTFRLRAANDYGTDEKDFTITVKDPPITYNTTRWEIVNNELVIDYKSSSGNTTTAKFPLQTSGSDSKFIITGLPANTTVNLPANWTIDTDERAVTINDTSKSASLADQYGIRISGAASLKVNYDGITLTARQIQNVTRWEISGSELVVECAGKTYRFSQYNADGDKYFIVAGLPNGAVINLPENWTVDTDGRAVTVGDASKSAQLASDSGVRISGACTITVNYAGITFVARQVSSGNEAAAPETYTVTRWELSGGQLVVEYKSSSGAATTARFTPQTSDGDKYFIVDGLPADTTINLPENWAVDTDGRAVTVSNTSKVSKLAPADGVRITGACTITAIYDGIMFTARQIQKSTRWELVGNELIVDCAVTTYRFQKYNADGDEYFIVKDIPNGAEINLPAGWTVDTDKRAVTVSDTSKVSQLTDEYGVRISGACTIMVNYAGITFAARQIPSGYRDTYVTTRWEVVNNELVVEYKASSGSENTANFQLQTLNGDNMYIITGLPENITINLPANWAVDTDGRAVTVSDASKVSRLADADGVRIAGACAITVNYDGITFTARQVHTVTHWEVVGNNLVIEYSGNTYTFPQSSIDGDNCFIIEGLPNGTMINLPSDWTLDTDGRAVTISDFAKMSALIDEYGVRIAGKSTITVNYSGITFTARRVHNVTRWEVIGDELIVECAGSTYSFAKNSTDGDEYFLVEGLPNGAVINLPEGWILDTDGRSVTVNDVYMVSSLADEYGVRIAGSSSITINYSGITFTARQSRNITLWEEDENGLIVEYNGNKYTFTKDNTDGNEYFLVEGLPNGAVINLPEDWILDTDGRGVTVNDTSKISALSDEYGVRITGPCSVMINYSTITLTARKVSHNLQESYSTTRWEIIDKELVIEYISSSGISTSAKFSLQTSDGDNRYIITGFPANITINLPENWMLDTVLDDVTVADPSKVTQWDNGEGNIKGKNSVTTKYSNVQFTARQISSSTAVPEFKTHSLLLSGQIGVNFYMLLPEISGVDYTNSYVDFNIAGDSSNPPQYFDAEFMNKKRTYYGFRCYIKSVQMADKINAVFHYGSNQTVTHEYSAKKYLDDSLAADISNEERALIEAIKDYGHYAQLYLSRINGWSLGTAHQAIDCENEYSASEIEKFRQAVDGYAIVRDIPQDSGIKRVGFSLNLDADTTINLYIYPEDDYTSTVSAYIPGSTINDAIYQPDRKRYKVEIKNIPAHQLADTFVVKVSGKKGFEVKVSAFSYVYDALNDANAQADEINTVAALYRYYVTTMAYRASTGQ